MLYKYTKTEWLNDILTNRQLWFSQIDELNDPFECNISAFYYGYDQYLEDKKEYEEMMKSKFFGSRQTPNHFYDHPRVDEFARHPDWVTDTINWLEDQYREYKKKRSGIYILSLSETKESPVLWGNYADNFKGTCICINEKKADKAMEKSGYQWQKVKVSYSAKTPKNGFSLEANIDSSIQWKHADWSYEKEIRYIIIDESIKSKGIKVNMEDAIEGIVIFKKNELHIHHLISQFESKTKIEVLQMSRTGWFESREGR